MSIFQIESKNTPCWYEIMWQKNPPGVIFRADAKLISEISLKKDDKEPWLFEALREKLSLPDIVFSEDFNEDWGFNNAFKRMGEKEGFKEFFFEIPALRKEVDDECNFCYGSGRDEFDGRRKCQRCNGSGKDHILDWDLAHTATANLMVIDRLLNWWIVEGNIKLTANFPQLLTVDFETIGEKRIRGYCIGGSISKALAEWLRSPDSKSALPEIIEAMRITHCRLFGKQTEYQMGHIRAFIGEDGRFGAACPGDACDIGPYTPCLDEDKGYQFSCHNVDSPMQQITLFVALAALHKKARESLGYK